jgi:hypothetical protein
MVFGSNVNILPPINKGWRVRSWLQSHIDVWLYFPRKAFSFVSCIKKTIKKRKEKGMHRKEQCFGNGALI